MKSCDALHATVDQDDAGIVTNLPVADDGAIS